MSTRSSSSSKSEQPQTMKITVETTVAAPIERVWDAWSNPADITQWNAPSPDWHTPRATVDLRVGGAFLSRMEAKDGGMGFDFAGTYTRIVRTSASNIPSATARRRLPSTSRVGASR
jgi:uncharacterized protein YndB with AHSA1/START domain